MGMVLGPTSDVWRPKPVGGSAWDVGDQDLLFKVHDFCSWRACHLLTYFFLRSL